MKVSDALNSRISVRAFLDKPVLGEVVKGPHTTCYNRFVRWSICFFQSTRATNLSFR